MSLRLAMITLSFLIAATANAASPLGIRWHGDFASAQRQLVEHPRPVLLFITSPGCSYCQRMKRETFADPRVSRRVAEGYVAIQVDGRRHANLTQTLKVRVFPTTAFITPGGKIVKVAHGFHPPAAFLKELDSAKDRVARLTAIHRTARASVHSR